MAYNFKKLCVKPVQNTLLDEIRVIKNIVDFRISAIESKIDLLISTCSSIFTNTETSKTRQSDTTKSLNDINESFASRFRSLEQLVSVLVSSSLCNNCGSDSSAMLTVGKGLRKERQNFRLTTVEDFPNGCWLGDEADIRSRVRVSIEPSTLLHINEICTTADKMALTLVDALFTRDTLAISNLSGKGKHSKQQLDPLLIYGVKCHLKHKFDITEEKWVKIQRNIDSKCRTMWRRKKRGLPLGNHRLSSIVNSSSRHDLNDFDSSDEGLDQAGGYETGDNDQVIDLSTSVVEDLSTSVVEDLSTSVVEDLSTSVVEDLSTSVVEDLSLPVEKHPPEDDFNLLPNVQLFTVEAADCFMLEGSELVIPECMIKDVHPNHHFLSK